MTARSVAPSAFEHAYEKERGRWLRKRLIAYLIATLVVGAVGAIPSVAMLFAHDRPPDAGVNVFVLLLSNLVFVVALVIAIRTQPIYEKALRIALRTYVVGALLTIGLTHMYTVWSVEPAAGGFAAVMDDIRHSDARHDRPPPSSRPATRPATIAGSLDRPSPLASRPASLGMFDRRYPRSYVDPIGKVGNYNARFTLPLALDHATFMIYWTYLLLSLGLSHLIISLFIPWTVRESLRPARMIALAFLLIAIVDVACSFIWWPFFIVALIALPFIFVPGTIVCWWRYSRFNKQFKAKFESEGFKQLQEELVGARKIHEANLPDPITDGPIRVAFEYEPMREIGGDLLMLHRSRGDSAITAVLLDVTGHGVSAALSVNRIIGEIERTFSEDADASPAKLVCNLNQYIAAILAKHQVFATAIVARIDTAAGTLEYVNAGHPPALLVGPFEARQTLDSTAMMLGVCENANFECGTTERPFGEHERLVLYTDGASEAVNLDGRMLGVAGTLELMNVVAIEYGKPEFWPAAVCDRIVRYREAPPTDDMLVVTLWRE